MPCGFRDLANPIFGRRVKHCYLVGGVSLLEDAINKMTTTQALELCDY